MPPINLLIKPASSNCNLKCSYCFYNSITNLKEVSNMGMMSEETLDVIVKKALEYADGFCTFAFQGGEPTLRGLDFFKKLIELQKKYNTKGVQINNALQTNGILIDEEWAKFFSQNKFLLGISLDGPKEIHDLNRVDMNNKGSFNKIINNIKILEKYKVDYNILFVINANSGRHAKKIYQFFKKQNFIYLQFIACLDAGFEQLGDEKFSLTPDRYYEFLVAFFDSWLMDIKNGRLVSVRYFDNILGIMLGNQPESCDMKGRCSLQFVVEGDGSVYPCDFYVGDEYIIGNFNELSIEQMIDSDISNKFITESLDTNEQCLSCRWGSLCRGGCKRHRQVVGDGDLGLNYYCSTYKRFFEYAADDLYKVSQLIRSGRLSIKEQYSN